jgi:hypothetical protein
LHINIHDAGKPAGSRDVDATLDVDSGKVTIGGAGSRVEIPGLSGGAAVEIAVAGQRATLRRVGGTPVTVGGREIASGAEIALGVETLISVGGRELVWKTAAAGGAAGGDPDTERPSLMARDVLKQVFNVLGVPEGDLPALVAYDAADKLVKRIDFPPQEEEVTIGRGSENRLVLHHASVSKNHARVVRDGVGFLVYDLESRNGVEVNGVRVRGKQRLSSGDRIRVGDFTVRFVDPKASNDLSASVPDLKRIDKAKPGEKVEVGDKGAGAIEETQPNMPASGKHSSAAVAASVAARAGSAPTPAPTADSAPAVPKEGSGFLVYLLIGIGVLLLLGAVVLIVLASRD